MQRTADAEPLAGAELVHSWSHALTGLEKRVWHSELAAIDAKLEPGAYTLRLTGEGPGESRYTQRTFLVTNTRRRRLTHTRARSRPRSSFSEATAANRWPTCRCKCSRSGQGLPDVAGNQRC